MNKVKNILEEDLCLDPIKVQFGPKYAQIFKVPLTEAWKDTTIENLHLSKKYPAIQGRFSIKKNKKTLLSVLGDRITIG